MENFVRKIDKILKMMRGFPTSGANNIIQLLEEILKEMRGRFATISWTVADLDEYDIPEDEKLPFLAERACEIQNLLVERGNDIIATFAEMNGYKRLEDDDGD